MGKTRDYYRYDDVLDFYESPENNGWVPRYEYDFDDYYESEDEVSPHCPYDWHQMRDTIRESLEPRIDSYRLEEEQPIDYRTDNNYPNFWNMGTENGLTNGSIGDIEEEVPPPQYPYDWERMRQTIRESLEGRMESTELEEEEPMNYITGNDYVKDSNISPENGLTNRSIFDTKEEVPPLYPYDWERMRDTIRESLEARLERKELKEPIEDPEIESTFFVSPITEEESIVKGTDNDYISDHTISSDNRSSVDFEDKEVQQLFELEWNRMQNQILDSFEARIKKTKLEAQELMDEFRSNNFRGERNPSEGMTKQMPRDYPQRKGKVFLEPMNVQNQYSRTQQTGDIHDLNRHPLRHIPMGYSSVRNQIERHKQRMESIEAKTRRRRLPYVEPISIRKDELKRYTPEISPSNRVYREDLKGKCTVFIRPSPIRAQVTQTRRPQTPDIETISHHYNMNGSTTNDTVRLPSSIPQEVTKLRRFTNSKPGLWSRFWTSVQNSWNYISGQ